MSFWGRLWEDFGTLVWKSCWVFKGQWALFCGSWENKNVESHGDNGILAWKVSRESWESLKESMRAICMIHWTRTLWYLASWSWRISCALERKRQADLFKGSLVYIESSSPDRATQWDPVSHTQKKDQLIIKKPAPLDWNLYETIGYWSAGAGNQMSWRDQHDWGEISWEYFLIVRTQELWFRKG